MSFKIITFLTTSTILIALVGCTSRVKEEILAKVNCDTTAVTYDSKINTILTTKCYGCHDPNQGATLPDLSTYNSSFQAKSSIIERITLPETDALHMPPTTSAQLSQCEKDALMRWVATGAKQN